MRERLQRAGGVVARVRRHNPDYKILMYTTVLLVIGLIIIFAIGPQRANLNNEAVGSDLSSMHYVVKQAISVLMAIVAFFFFAFGLKVEKLLQWRTLLLIIGFALSALLVLFGNIGGVESVTQCAYGACRWFVLPGVGTFQPSEALKFALLIFLAGYLAVRMKKGSIDDWQKTILPLGALMAVVALFVVVFQKDLGTGVALFAIAASMLVVSGLSLRMSAILGMVLLVVGLLLIISAPHRIDRMMTFLEGDTSSVEDASGYHIAHAKIAIGSGGVFGVGIGNSVQAAGYLPEAINDSVFAILGETFGFIGLVFILAMFYMLLRRILQLIDRLEQLEYKLIAAGVFGWVGSHVIINVMAMTGLIPLTGITLPFLSIGGTSMVIIAAALGVVFQISRYTVHGKITEESHEGTRSRRRDGRTRYTSPRRTR